MDLSQLAPWLFGQHESYLVKQLEDFKSGNRANDTSQTMHQVAVDLTPKKMRVVAFYLAHKQPIKGAK
jgi:cytochrome c553